MIMVKDFLSSYYEGQLKADTFINENGTFGCRFWKDNVWQKDELYEGHNEIYADNAAENYVLGVKKL